MDGLAKKWAKAKPGYKIQIVSNYRKVGLVLFLEVKAQNPIFLVKYEKYFFCYLLELKPKESTQYQIRGLSFFLTHHQLILGISVLGTCNLRPNFHSV